MFLHLMVKSFFFQVLSCLRQVQLYLKYMQLCSTGIVNSPNPNGSEFPMKFSDLTKTSAFTNSKLQSYIDTCSVVEKLYGQEEEPFCLMYKKDVGRPLG
jgi:hypothetical protein